MTFTTVSPRRAYDSPLAGPASPGLTMRLSVSPALTTPRRRPAAEPPTARDLTAGPAPPRPAPPRGRAAHRA